MASTRLINYLVGLLLGLCSVISAGVHSNSKHEAPFVSVASTRAVPHRYFITLRRNCTLNDHLNNIQVSRRHGHFNELTDFTEHFQVYSGEFPPSQLRRIRTDRPCVRRVSSVNELSDPVDTGSPSKRELAEEMEAARQTEDDIHLSKDRQKGNVTKRGLLRKKPKQLWTTKTQKAHWNLAAMSHTSRVTKNLGLLKRTYTYAKGAGFGTDIYVFSRGIFADLEDFGGRASVIEEAVVRKKGNLMYTERAGIDQYKGEGTHMAALAASKTFGVSKKARIVDVPVFARPSWYQRPTYERLLYAIHLVIRRHRLNRDQFQRGNNSEWSGSVILMSVQSREMPLLIRKAIERADNLGIVIIAPAGDENLRLTTPVGRFLSARPVYPCQLAVVICVGAISKSYTKELDSNYGRSVNMFAPGDSVFSANLEEYGAKFSKRFLFGTKYAAAHVAGVVAIYIGWEKLFSDGLGVKYRLIANGLRDVLDVKDHYFNNDADDIIAYLLWEGYSMEWIHGNFLRLGARFLANTGIEFGKDPTVPYNKTVHAPRRAYLNINRNRLDYLPVRMGGLAPDVLTGEKEGEFRDPGYGRLPEIIAPPIPAHNDPVWTQIGGPYPTVGAIPPENFRRPNRNRFNCRPIDDSPSPYSKWEDVPDNVKPSDDPMAGMDAPAEDPLPTYQELAPEVSFIPDPSLPEYATSDPHPDARPAPSPYDAAVMSSVVSPMETIETTSGVVPELPSQTYTPAPSAPPTQAARLLEPRADADEESLACFLESVRPQPPPVPAGPPAFICAQSSALQVSAQGAQGVLSTLNLEVGHVCSYDNDGEGTPVVPCVDGACLYWEPGQTDEDEVSDPIDGDCAVVADALEQLIKRCTTKNGRFTGGLATLPLLSPYLGMVLGPSRGDFD